LVRFAPMRQLLPVPADDVDPVARYAEDARPPPPGRPWVVVNMIASLDGATAIDGVSGGLGGPADKAVFAALRSLADVILVAAGTVRAERYGPVRLPDARQAERTARGQAPVPRLAIMTASLDLDLGTPLFDGAGGRPLVLTTTDAPAERRAAVARAADVVTFGAGSVDLAAALAWLAGEHGARVVLCEGGPRLNGALVAADLVDEWCQTIAPLLVGGGAARPAHGVPAAAVPLQVERVLEADGLLFIRSVRAGRDR